jgi:DNA helicase II / ATP-dependent DNA helicase PcrA
MNESDRVYEQDRLKTTIVQIEEQLTSSTNNRGESQAELRDTLGNYWDNMGRNIADEAQLVEIIGRQRSIATLANHRHQQLKKMLNSPYFGRIDFTEDYAQSLQPTEQIYVGISTLTDPLTDEIFIYDWRTPVAGMFYDFERGEAWYDCPAGMVKGFITLKRQYKVVNGQMQYMFESDIKIDDEMLQELLGKSADDKMHTIVTSIQREQNKVIRNEGHRLLFVQGPAGSGKTSIALHRVAYLLYRERKVLTSKNVLILSPNYIFSDYISNVLPEIGEENVLQMTFQDYALRLKSDLNMEIESRTNQLEYLLSNPDGKGYHTRIANIRYKSSLEFETVIQKFLDFLQNRLILDYPAIKFGDQIIFSQEDWQHYYLKSLAFLPPTRRLAKIRELIQIRMRPLVHDLRQKKVAEITASAEEVNQKHIQALARISAKNELTDVNAEIERLTVINPLELYRKIFRNEDFYQRFAVGTSVPNQWPAIRKQTLFALNSGKLAYEDSLPFLYFRGVLDGFPIKPEIKHVVIDEAQDYTGLQYKILMHLFPNCSWTILGDPAQAIHPYIQTADFKTASRIINQDQAAIVHLTRSYRSTLEIQSFCQALLPAMEAIESVNRSGPLPRVIDVGNADTRWAVLAQEIQECQKEGWQSIAIICKTAQTCSTAYDVLARQLKLTHIKSEDDEFHRGIVVLPSYLAKGLEFDAVFVVDVGFSSYNREEERNILYTVCTRALHRLTLFYTGVLTPFIKTMNSKLYEMTSHK